MRVLVGLLEPVGGGATESWRLHPLVREHCARQRFQETPKRFGAIHDRTIEANMNETSSKQISMISAYRTFLVLGLSLAVGIAPFAGAQDDHGDTSAEATLLRIGAAVGGELDSGSDTDVFRLDLVGRAEVEVRTSGQTDTMGELLDSTGARLVSDDDGGPGGNNFGIEVELDPGVYYVAVQGDAGTYSINARLGGQRDHGDTPESSTLLKLHTKDELATVSPSVLLATSGRIHPSTDDTDVFRLDVAEDDTDVMLRTSPASYDTYGVLVDASGNQIAADEDGDGAFRIATTLDEGIFYASVTAIEVGAYRILGQGDPGVPTPGGGAGGGGGTCEAQLRRAGGTQTVNVALSAATAVRLGTRDDQYIVLDNRLDGQMDYGAFKMPADRAGSVIVVSVSDLDTEAVVFDEDCNTVGTVVSDVGTLEGIDASNLDFGFVGDLAPGDYYLVVFEWRGRAGDYALGFSIGNDDDGGSTGGYCVDGGVVDTGDSCAIYDTSATFDVSSTGTGCFRSGGFLSCSTTSQNLRNTTINGVTFTFVANRNTDNSWTVSDVDPEPPMSSAYHTFVRGIETGVPTRVVK